MSCSYIFELGDCRQGSEELPMCLISMDISQNRSLTQSHELPPSTIQAPVNKLVSLTWLLWALRSFRSFTLHYIIHTLLLGAICLRKVRRTVLLKKILKPSKRYKHDSIVVGAPIRLDGGSPSNVIGAPPGDSLLSVGNLATWFILIIRRLF